MKHSGNDFEKSNEGKTFIIFVILLFLPVYFICYGIPNKDHPVQ